MPETSVIIPTYQHAGFVAQAVTSALAQTYKDYEIIVVDDGSTDNTPEILAKFDDRITVIYQKNCGVSGARNTGIRASKGEYVAFLDGDDVWKPEKLEKQIPLFKRNPIVGLVGADMLIFDEKGLWSYTPFQRIPPQSGNLYETIFANMGRSFILMPTVVVRRVCFEDVGFFDETLTGAEDHDMWLRISKNWAVDFVNEPLASYRLSANNAHKNVERQLYNILLVQEKAVKSSPELCRLDISILDHCFYNYYLALARFYIEQRRKSDARSLLRRYAEIRGRTLRYYRNLAGSFAPDWLWNILVKLR